MTAASTWTARPLLPLEAAILGHPDQRTTWAPAIVVELRDPLPLREAQARLDTLVARHSILGARLGDGGWLAGTGPAITEFDGELAALCRRFDLGIEPPLRVALAPDRYELALVSHHAALDGRALVTVARALLGDAGAGDDSRAAALAGPAPSGGDPRAAAPAGPAAPSGSGGGRRAMVGRLLRPAHRVAPSARTGRAEDADAFASVELPEGRSLRVASLAAAAVEAVAGWNEERSTPWRRLGLTVPVGGPEVLGNVSTHRRVDLSFGADVAAVVNAAIAEADPPPDVGSPLLARLLAPVVDRFSDSLLVSNLGRIDLPGAEAVDFYPQARGRSAVALGAATVAGEAGRRRLTLRARDLSDADARLVLARIVEQLPRA